MQVLHQKEEGEKDYLKVKEEKKEAPWKISSEGIQMAWFSSLFRKCFI